MARVARFKIESGEAWYHLHARVAALASNRQGSAGDFDDWIAVWIPAEPTK